MSNLKRYLQKLDFLQGIVVITIFFLSSCSHPDNCVKSTGKIIEEERTLDSFSVIHIADNVQLYLLNSGGSTITVKAGKNLISDIKTEIVGNVLYITNENRCDWLRSFKKDIIVYAGIKNVKTIYNYGSANVNSDLLIKDTLFFHHYGDGDVHLNCNSNLIWMDMDHLGDFIIEGNVNQLNATSLNLGELKAQGLLANTIWLTNNGQSDSYVNAVNVLGATINNSGNVYYYGNPTSIDRVGSGSGQLIKAN